MRAPLGFAYIFVDGLRVLRLAAGSRMTVVWRADGGGSPKRAGRCGRSGSWRLRAAVVVIERGQSDLMCR